MIKRSAPSVLGTFRTYLLAALAAAGFATYAGNAAAASSIVGNGSFETPAISKSSQTIAAGSSALAPWVIGGHSIDLVGNFW